MKNYIINKDSENILKWNAIVRNKQGIFTEERILFLKIEARPFYMLKKYFHGLQLNLKEHPLLKQKRETDTERERISVCFVFVFRE